MAGIHEPGAGLITGTGITGAGAAFDWPTEERFWQGRFPDLSYINADRTYDFYEPAFRYGSESAQATTRDWDEMEPELRAGWGTYPHKRLSASTWDEVRPAVHDAWHQCRARYPLSGRKSAGSTETRDRR